jgi:hypothetical protein
MLNNVIDKKTNAGIINNIIDQKQSHFPPIIFILRKYNNKII